jgi:RimJ/RimL family protein N-acetyltransferase
MTNIPVIETERLILRVQTTEDFPAFAAMWADPVVTRYIGGTPLNEEESWAKFMRIAGHWALLGFGYWGIFEKTSGKRIGEAGILDVKRNITPSFHGAPEIGWGLLPEVHGKGYATEAARAIIGWAENHFGKVRMVCIIDPDNAPSLRVAARCGFREVSHTMYKGEPTIILERLP